ncbi:MAG: alpha/beta hydrolase [Proteobacteria bacterium]|nr:alpha/beta hydrolase [Pseudomonadota bacterium]
MSKIRIHNNEIYYELHGKGHPLVLIGGYSCDHTFWKSILEELANHFQVLVFDNRGIGQSTQINQLPFHLEDLAADTIALIQSLGLEQPYLLGQSMGGAIAQTVADQFNDIKKLIILNSSTQVNARTLMVLETFIMMLKEKISIDSVIEASIPWFFSAQYLFDSSNILKYKAELMQNPFPPTIQILEQQLSALKMFNSNSWINRVKNPTLVISSDEDIICTPAECKVLAQRMPNAQLVNITGGHSSPIENPLGVINAIKDFLKTEI